MLTTTVDGLWVLQAVTGVEQTCPELGLRPLLPRLDTAERALRHPVAAELMAVGALDQAGNADPMVREWLTVLLRRDLGLLVTIGVPGGEPTRAAICRFATWWVVLERHGNLVRLYPAGTASDEAGAGELVVGQVERLCGVAEAAPLRPVTVDADERFTKVGAIVEAMPFDPHLAKGGIIDTVHELNKKSRLRLFEITAGLADKYVPDAERAAQ